MLVFDVGYRRLFSNIDIINELNKHLGLSNSKENRKILVICVAISVHIFLKLITIVV